ncbi:MAG: glycogen synthase GlgA [Wenzhouxiangella sp.]|jgi:starch synthase|nr:glycogen synthase GlgA [Wenzhouxiangella sp.]
MRSPNLRVLIAATEIYPLAKTGGLADATAALGAALAALDQDVHFIMPAYPQALEQLRLIDSSVALPIINGHEGGLLLSARTPDSHVPIHLVDLPSLYRDGGGLYVDADGHERADNPQRFGALSHAIAHLACGELGQARFDLVHCNDWHTGLTPLLLHNQTRATPPATVFTIHNMAFQGQCSAEQWSELGVPLSPEQWPRVEYYGQVSFLKAGLEFSDQLTTVSPRYAQEIQTAEFGFGLEGVVRARRDRLTGILNGIDESIWSPERSPWVPVLYSADALSGKAICKQLMQQELRLDVNPAAPLMVFIGRLTWQKMADVLLEAIPGYLLAEPDRQFVLLGNGDPDLESAYLKLVARYPGRVAVLTDYAEPIAHRLHAGGDILIHGSRYEPCGLTQLYAMCFGTIPIVRPVGGLADTVVDVSAASLESGRATGFYFEEPSAPAMLTAIDRAVSLYRDSETWQGLQQTAMRQDFGWEKSVRAYLDVYRRACP